MTTITITIITIIALFVLYRLFMKAKSKPIKLYQMNEDGELVEVGTHMIIKGNKIVELK